jgi:ATP synthase F1, gamma subunit
MKGMREIRNRIKAVKGTGQITHAMELVAASKMRKAQQSAENGRAYATLLMDMTETVMEQIGSIMKGGKTDSKRSKRLIIVFSTDKGLCGSLNTNLFKTIAEIKGDAEFIAVGNRAARFIARIGKPLKAQFSVSDHVKFAEVRKIAEFAMKTAKEQGDIGSIEVLYPLFINTLRQEPTFVKIAPVDDLDEFIERLRKSYKLDTEKRPQDTREILFEPSPKEILAELPQFYIKQALYQMALDAKASEHSARMVAMKSASDNADDLVRCLTIEYNKARQEAITTEITELAAAAQAMENNS